MEFIRTIKEKQLAKHQDDLRKIAEDKFCLEDFDQELYIAYEGTPLIYIEDSWLPKQIINELSKLRQNYVKSRMRHYKPSLIESLLKIKTTC